MKLKNWLASLYVQWNLGDAGCGSLYLCVLKSHLHQTNLYWKAPFYIQKIWILQQDFCWLCLWGLPRVASIYSKMQGAAFRIPWRGKFPFSKACALPPLPLTWFLSMRGFSANATQPSKSDLNRLSRYWATDGGWRNEPPHSKLVRGFSQFSTFYAGNQ